MKKRESSKSSSNGSLDQKNIRFTNELTTIKEFLQDEVLMRKISKPDFVDKSMNSIAMMVLNSEQRNKTKKSDLSFMLPYLTEQIENKLKQVAADRAAQTSKDRRKTVLSSPKANPNSRSKNYGDKCFQHVSTLEHGVELKSKYKSSTQDTCSITTFGSTETRTADDRVKIKKYTSRDMKTMKGESSPKKRTKNANRSGNIIDDLYR
jgi:hypothetical protein